MSIGGDWSGNDSYTEVTSQGWFSRMAGSLIGIPIGLLLFLGSFFLLFWNEGRAVRTAKSLAEGEKAVVSVGIDKVDPALENALIHVSGKASTEETINDPQFPVSSKALRLARDVKMYQWIEKKQTRSRNKIGGGQETITEYTYERGWADHPVDSASFKIQDGHQNPNDWRYRGWSSEAGVVTLGAFRLPSDLVGKINTFQPLFVNQATRDALPEELRNKFLLDNGRFYMGTSPTAPRIGDLAIEFRQVLPTEISLLAQQTGNSFQPYQTKSGDAISRLQLGMVTADEMFKAAETENVIMTWGLRLLGFVLMSVGIGMVLQPQGVFGDVIPLVGSIIRFGNAFVAIGISLVLSLVTIALGWMSFRPVVGVGVLVVAGLVLFGFLRMAKSRRPARTARNGWSPTPGPV